MNPKDATAAMLGGMDGGSISNGSQSQYSPSPMSPVQRVLDRLSGVKQHGDKWTARCPAHEDEQPSLSVAEGKDGCVLLKCHAGCPTEAIMAAIGLAMNELFHDKPKRGAETRNKGGGGGYPSQNHCNTATPSVVEREDTASHAQEVLLSPDAIPSNTDRTPTGCTLAEYSEAKRIPIPFLKSIGLLQITYCDAPAVRIPYQMRDGTDGPTRFRIAMTGDRFRWKSGSRPCLYGLDRLNEARKAGHTTVVEGESDCHTLWYRDISAVGLPGAGNWQEARDAHHLDGLDRLYFILEPDDGGAAVKRWLATSAIRDRAFLVNLKELTGFKDPSALYLDNPDRFTERWQVAIDAARPWADVAREDAEAAARQAYAEAEPLATCPDILAEYANTVKGAGLVGEQRAAKLLFLALTSRVLDKPVSVAIKGPSSGGKSFTAETVLSFFPESAVYSLSGASALALNFSGESFAHRFLYFAEAAGMGDKDGKLQAMLRTLMSESRLVYDVTIKRSDGTFGVQHIVKDGPTGFITTTTAEGLHNENETRFFSVRTDDTRAQTAAVIARIFDERPRDVDRAPWLALQRWLDASEHRVTLPFGAALGSLINPFDNRLRRDASAIRGLICAHALLHQRNRERDTEGRIVATIADYAAVYALSQDIVSEGVKSTVNPKTRETVEAVRALATASGDDSGAAVTQVAERLNIGESAASRRLTSARKAGYIVNNEPRQGVLAKYVIGGPLRDDSGVLPTPDEVARVWGRCDRLQAPNAEPREREGETGDAENLEVLQCCSVSGQDDCPSPLCSDSSSGISLDIGQRVVWKNGGQQQTGAIVELPPDCPGHANVRMDASGNVATLALRDLRSSPRAVEGDRRNGTTNGLEGE